MLWSEQFFWNRQCVWVSKLRGIGEVNCNWLRGTLYRAHRGRLFITRFRNVYASISISDDGDTQFGFVVLAMEELIDIGILL